MQCFCLRTLFTAAFGPSNRGTFGLLLSRARLKKQPAE